MSNYESELIVAERRGRALAASLEPTHGDLWLTDIGAGPEAAALAAAARWGERLGAKVERRLALFNRLQRIRSGKRSEIRDIPPPCDALARTPVAARLFVKPIDAASPRMTCAQCRMVDQKAIRVLGVPGLCLMENASLDALPLVMDMLGSPAAGQALVAAGGGNNGGDGLALARMLLELGVQTKVALLKPKDALVGDAAINLRLLESTPGSVIHDIHNRPDALGDLAGPCRLLVDALLGTGFKGELAPAFRAAIAAINAAGKPVLALDLPSGIDGDTGAAAGIAVKAGRTITFAAVKIGLELADGPAYSGEIYLGDIGAPDLAFS